MKNAWRSAAARAVLIVVLTVVAYLPALRAGFVFDDSELITGNPMVRASDGLYRFWCTTEPMDYWPLTSTVWWLEWRIWGANAMGYHVVNVLLHAANAVLVWVILRRLKIPGAWLAGLVFAIHPVNVATVAWISELKNTLSMLFYAVAILLYLRFDEEGRWPWYGLSLVAFLLALLSKAAVVMLPVVLLGCVWWMRGRVRWNDFLRSVPFFALSLVLGLVTIWFQYHQGFGEHLVRTEGPASRLAAAGWVPWFYLYKALLPLNLTVVYPKWQIDVSRWVSYVPGVILIGCLILFWWKRQSWGRPWLFGLGYFVVTLSPVLGFFRQSFHRHTLVADHWQYYSIVGAIALAVAVVEKIWRRLGGPARYAGTVAGVVVLLALAAGTWRRGCVYADDETLWRDNVAKNPNAWLVQYNLGSALSHAGKPVEAIGWYEQALRINPDYAEAHNNLGAALVQVGKIQEAIGHYEQALRIRPNYAEAHNNLGAALVQAGQVPEAIRQYEAALRIKPDSAGVYYNLGIAAEQAGRFEEAIGQYRQALRIKPDYADAHNNLGAALMQTGQVPEAIAHWEQALRIKPDYTEAHYNLGVALAQLGNLPEAIGHWEQALRIQPDYVKAHYTLGVALAGLGRLQEAVGHWEQVVRIQPDYAEAHYNLGVALARLGNSPEAIEHWEQALRIKPDYAEAHYNLGVALEQAGKVSEAKAHYERALKIKPD